MPLPSIPPSHLPYSLHFTAHTQIDGHHFILGGEITGIDLVDPGLTPLMQVVKIRQPLSDELANQRCHGDALTAMYEDEERCVAPLLPAITATGVHPACQSSLCH